MITTTSSHFAERRAMEKALHQAAARRRHEQLAAVFVRPVIAGFKTTRRGKVTLPFISMREI